MSTEHILDQLDAELGPAAAVRHHVLRRNGNTLLDIPITAPDGRRPWAATLWPNPDGSWQRSLWTARPRGYQPIAVHYGDVIEFGTGAGPTAAIWYGHLTDTTPDAIIITGLYPTAHDAYQCAQDPLHRWRESRLASHGARTVRLGLPATTPT